MYDQFLSLLSHYLLIGFYLGLVRASYNYLLSTEPDKSVVMKFITIFTAICTAPVMLGSGIIDFLRNYKNGIKFNATVEIVSNDVEEQEKDGN